MKTIKPMIMGLLKIAACLLAAAAPLVIVSIVGFTVFQSNYEKIYETSSISDYGVVQGNIDNSAPQEFIYSFFPNELDDSFADVVYHYKAKYGDTYAYEAYLEFVIEDEQQFDSFRDSVLDIANCCTFRYDDHFQEYTISDVLYLIPTDNAAQCSIGNAKIGKVLFSEDENRFIFVALGVFDGGGANTGELNYFFSKFDIEPLEYSLHAYMSEWHQSQGPVNQN